MSEKEMIYECVRCSERFPISQIEELDFRCPNCKYKVFKKIRPPVVRRVKAI
jgi:DNA-directed RNA polymerase subunit RPC12/RpoP